MSNEKKVKKSKGLDFEYKVSNMLQKQKYFSRRGIPITFGEYNEDASDVDVIGIKFFGLFQKSLIIADCKNKNRAKPYERIFWAKGIGEFIKADGIFVALNKTKIDIMKYANSNGVKILLLEKINQYTIESRIINSLHFYELEFDLSKNTKKNKEINNISLNYRKLYLLDNPYLAINISLSNILTLYNELERVMETEDVDYTDSLKYLICELTTVIGVHILNICSDVFELSEEDRKIEIMNRLTYGELNPRVVNGILENTKNLAYEVIKSEVPKEFLPKSLDLGRISPPNYTDNIIGLIERAIERPELYIDLPQLLDYLLFEQGLYGNNETEKEIIKHFGYGLTDERWKTAKNILHFIKVTCNVDWKKIWKNPKGKIEQLTISDV